MCAEWGEVAVAPSTFPTEYMIPEYESITRRAEDAILDYVAMAKFALTEVQYRQSLRAAIGVLDLWKAAVELPDDPSMRAAAVKHDAFRLEWLCDPEHVPPNRAWANKAGGGTTRVEPP